MASSHCLVTSFLCKLHAYQANLSFEACSIIHECDHAVNLVHTVARY